MVRKYYVVVLHTNHINIFYIRPTTITQSYPGAEPLSDYASISRDKLARSPLFVVQFQSD